MHGDVVPAAILERLRGQPGALSGATRWHGGIADIRTQGGAEFLCADVRFIFQGGAAFQLVQINAATDRIRDGGGHLVQVPEVERMFIWRVRGDEFSPCQHALNQDDDG